MCLATVNTAATGCANGNRREKLTTGAISQFRELADDLVKSRVNVISELDFGNGSQTVHAHTNCRTDNATFGDRRIDDAMLAVFAL